MTTVTNTAAEPAAPAEPTVDDSERATSTAAG